MQTRKCSATIKVDANWVHTNINMCASLWSGVAVMCVCVCVWGGGGRGGGGSGVGGGFKISAISKILIAMSRQFI